MTDDIVIEDYRGEANPLALIPSMGSSFKDINELKEIVHLLERWQYRTALEKLDHVINHGHHRVDALLLKGELYALFEYNEETRKVLELVLQEDPDNVYALTLILVQLKIVSGHEGERDTYSQRLKVVSPNVYQKLHSVFQFIENNKNKMEFPIIDQTLDLICVFGYFLYDDGTLPIILQERLKKTYELALRHPSATILLSGGAVQNKYCEALEMKRFLVDAGIEETRLVALETAKDTVGNIIEFMTYIKPRTFQHMCCISSAEHLPRAWMSFVMGLKESRYSANVCAVAPSDVRDPLVMAVEHKLNYQTVLRVAGLFEKKDIQKLL